MEALLRTALIELDSPTPLTIHQAQHFLQAFPPPAIFSVLQYGDLNAKDVARGLQKVLATGIVVPDIVVYSQMALLSPEPALRELALQQFGKALQECLETSEIEAAEDLAFRIVKALLDPDIGVAATAKRILELAASDTPGLSVVLGSECQSGICTLISSRDAVVKLRALSLVTTLASTNPEAAARIRSSGLLVPLTDELSHPEDPLGCAAGLQLVTQLAQQSGPAAIGFLGDNLVGSLRGLVAHGDAFLRSSALQACGALLASALAAGISEESQQGDIYAFALQCLEEKLSRDSEEEEEVVNAALVTIQQIASSPLGREVLSAKSSIPLSVAERAIGTTGSSAGRITAMHSLSYLLGATRLDEDWSPANATLSQEAEKKLREALFSAAASNSLAGTLLGRLKQPFEESRVAVLRLLLAIGLHSWGARELLSHTELMQLVSSAEANISYEVSLWRQACIKGLLATARSASGIDASDILGSYIPDMEASLRQGSSSRQPTQPPQIDVVRR